MEESTYLNKKLHRVGETSKKCQDCQLHEEDAEFDKMCKGLEFESDRLRPQKPGW